MLTLVVISDEQATEIRSKYEQGLNKSKLAQEYGVSRMTIMRMLDY